MDDSLIKRFTLFSSVTARNPNEAIDAIEPKRISKILARSEGKNRSILSPSEIL
jgi:hypothetical protein